MPQTLPHIQRHNHNNKSKKNKNNISKKEILLKRKIERLILLHCAIQQLPTPRQTLAVAATRLPECALDPQMEHSPLVKMTFSRLQQS
jgi:hypothetical protein